MLAYNHFCQGSINGQAAAVEALSSQGYLHNISGAELLVGAVPLILL